MDANLQRYLRAIQFEMGAGATAGDQAAEHMTFCLRSLLARLVAQDELAPEARDGWRHALLPLLQRLRDHEWVRARCESILAELDALTSATEIDSARLQDGLGRLVVQLVACDEPEVASISRSLVAQDLGHWDRVHARNAELMKRSSTASQQASDRLDAECLDRIAALLRETYDEPADFGIAEARTVPGGFSKQTTIVTLTGNRILPTQVVVRRDRPESPAGSTVLDEFPLLQVLHVAGVKVPAPLAADAQAVAGNPIIVVSREAGEIIADNHLVHDVSYAEPRLKSLAEQHARFHRIPIEALPRGMRGADLTTRQFVEGEIVAFRDRWRALNESSLIMEAAFEWLLRHIDYSEGARGLVHSDSRLQNVLVDDQGVCAILDWEMAVVGNPARDLAYVHEHVVQLGDWRQFLDWYGEAGGIVPTEDEIDFYLIWSNLWNCTFGWIARALFLAGTIDSLPIAYVGEDFRQRNLRLVARHLYGAMGKAS